MAETPEIPPFRSLGYLNGTYYYYSRGEQAVVPLQAGAHTKKNLYRLAPNKYWSTHYAVTKTNDFDENGAASALMASCQRAGIFSVKWVRGRGVWMDKSSPIIHYGDKVTIEGKDYAPYLTPGKHVYELAEPLGFAPCAPLHDTRGAHLIELMKRLRWQTPDQFMWFSGWLVCALIGGALYWRPHIWLTGGAQSGKTTLSKIINMILRNNCLYIKSVSTEAGIRQTLKADCLAVVMDEAEREDSASHSRIQSVLTLARQASSDDDSRIVKGTPSGVALNFQIRSPFCLSSINSSLVQTADKGRFTNIELSSVKLSGEEYDAWKDEMDALLTEEFVHALYSRIFAIIPTITANSKTFAKIIERKTGDRRLGDQYGALMAGYTSLYDTRQFDEATSASLLENMNFESEKEKANGINDQHRLLNKIMQHVVRMPKDKGYEDITVGDMCHRVYKKIDEYNYCKSTLANMGIKVIHQYGDEKIPCIAIANDNDNLADILKGSTWPDNWKQTLQRLTFAKPSAGGVYFSAACNERATILPVANVLFESPD